MAYSVEPDSSLFNPEFSQNYFIQGSLPWIIIISYLMFVKVFGPRIMKDRKALDPKQLILTYNSFMVVANVGLCYTASQHLLELWPYHCDFQKSPVYTDRPKFLFGGWYFLLVKYVELLDTVFFIVRKKFNQASFLHVFHHAIMCAMLTVSLKYNMFSYYHFLIGSVNSGVHILLYSYYGLSSLRPEVMRKYSWCKKYLTTLQILQFFLYLVYMLYSNLFECGLQSWGFDSLVFLLIVAITALFMNFYYRTYK